MSSVRLLSSTQTLCVYKHRNNVHFFDRHSTHYDVVCVRKMNQGNESGQRVEQYLRYYRSSVEETHSKIVMTKDIKNCNGCMLYQTSFHYLIYRLQNYNFYNPARYRCCEVRECWGVKLMLSVEWLEIYWETTFCPWDCKIMSVDKGKAIVLF